MSVLEIGEIGVPVVNLTFSGVELATTGVSGTVIDRKVNGANADGSTSYIYLFEFPTPLTVGSGTESQLGSRFWLDEYDLGLSVEPPVGPDVASLAQGLDQAKVAVGTSKNDIMALLTAIPEGSSFHDNISRLLSVVTDGESVLSAKVIPSPDQAQEIALTGRETARDSSNIELNAQVCKELAENLYGVYTIVAEQETAQKVAEAQARLQQQLADEDDAQNLNAFINTYINNEGSTSLLTPGTVDAAGETDPSSLTDDSGLDPDTLITNNLTLEQD